MLEEQRARDVAFDEAWTAALAAVRWPHETDARRQWREALTETREEWRACYEGRPTLVCSLLQNVNPALWVIEGESGPEGHRAVA